MRCLACTCRHPDIDVATTDHAFHVAGMLVVHGLHHCYVTPSLAQAIEAATAGETRSGSTLGKSPVPSGMRPNTVRKEPLV